MTWASAAEIAAAIRRNDRYLVTTHQRADGDAIGAVAATSLVLRRLGKRHVVVLDDGGLDPRYGFLPGLENVVWEATLPELGWKPEWALILDAPVHIRLGRLTSLLPAPERVMLIDHHAAEEPLGVLHLLRESASSTCEVLYEVIGLLGLEVDRDLATALYTGIVFDTSQFRFSNTTPQSMRVCAELIERGACPQLISQKVFYERTEAATRLLAAALQSLELGAEGRLASLMLTHETFRALGGAWHELEGIVDYATSIRGVEVGLFYKELRPGFVRISMRSKGAFNVRDFAARYGGGGHEKAAGCSVRGTIEEVRARIDAEVGSALSSPA